MKLRATWTRVIEYEVDEDAQGYAAPGEPATPEHVVAVDREAAEDDPFMFFDVDEPLIDTVTVEAVTGS